MIASRILLQGCPVAPASPREGCADLLDGIKLPVGIGVGDEDVATVPEKSERMHAAIKGLELAVFDRGPVAF